METLLQVWTAKLYRLLVLFVFTLAPEGCYNIYDWDHIETLSARYYSDAHNKYSELMHEIYLKLSTHTNEKLRFSVVLKWKEKGYYPEYFPSFRMYLKSMESIWNLVRALNIC